MRKADIPAFVHAVIDTGCEICAVGHRWYVFGDGDLPPAQRDAIAPRLREIEETFGERDHLKMEIVAYLRSIGRYIEIER
ncbi:hypothetical protein [Chelativorans alearense]|uniref:hypothetical protein n=1 Tax=Chelativorans alearense TaxID=2681495 RepID=UPI0013D149D0|nr:hypothetical protein [Chelativorans alearense]